MQKLLLVAALALSLVADSTMAANRVTTPTCEIADPPAEAGEEAHMGSLLLLFPRARDIDKSFSGCQSIWSRQGETTKLVGRIEFKAGEAIAMHDSVTGNVCRYRGGKLSSGSSSQCRDAAPTPIPSLAPGCMRAAAATKASESAGCEDYE